MKITRDKDQRLYELIWHERKAWEHVMVIVTGIYMERVKELKALEKQRKKRKRN